MIYKTKIKQLRYLGCKMPSFTKKKVNKRINKPGQHSFFYSKKTSVKKLFTIQLKNKQKLKLFFCISERQLKNYIKLILGIDKKTPFISLYNLLHLRFDFLVYKLNFSKTILQARQLISHGHFFLNDIKQKRPGYICQVGSRIMTISTQALDNIHKHVNHRVHVETFDSKINGKFIMKVDKPKIIDLKLINLIQNAFEFYL